MILIAARMQSSLHSSSEELIRTAVGLIRIYKHNLHVSKVVIVNMDILSVSVLSFPTIPRTHRRRSIDSTFERKFNHPRLSIWLP